jgi:acyl-CoA thioesterase FadM
VEAWYSEATVILETPVTLPRNAFTPRDAARAGDLWRAFQDVATDASARCGWPPSRYNALGVGFVVRTMTVAHRRETRHGERLRAQTWVKAFRRGVLCTREIRILAEDGLVSAATQEWVHVQREGGLRPARASAELVASFEPDDPEPSPELPAWEPVEGARVHTFAFRCWHTWMDPLGHANHPAYVDWCDEATSRAMAASGLTPLALAPVAESVTWRTGVVAPDEVDIATRLVGRTARGDAVLAHDLRKGDGALCAAALTLRRLVDGGSDALVAALR